MKTLALDFDGVIAEYDGWKGEDDLGAPKEGLIVFLRDLLGDGWCFAIHSTRDSSKIQLWVEKHLSSDILMNTIICDKKPMAIAYLDDRGICFNGQFSPELAIQIKTFQPYWKNNEQ